MAALATNVNADAVTSTWVSLRRIGRRGAALQQQKLHIAYEMRLFSAVPATAIVQTHYVVQRHHGGVDRMRGASNIAPTDHTVGKTIRISPTGPLEWRRVMRKQAKWMGVLAAVAIAVASTAVAAPKGTIVLGSTNSTSSHYVVSAAVGKAF